MNEIIIGKAVNALVNRDYKAFSSCFSEAADFADFCPLLEGGENVFLTGSIGIELYFHERFSSGRFCAAEPKIESSACATLFCEYDNGPYLYTRLSIEALDSRGLISRAVMHPA